MTINNISLNVWCHPYTFTDSMSIVSCTSKFEISMEWRSSSLNTFTFWVADDSGNEYTIDHSVEPYVNGWAMLSLVYDSTNSTMEAYVNGGNPDTVSTGGHPVNDEGVLELIAGAKNQKPEKPFHGKIWDVRFYQDVLTSTQIQALHDTVDNPSRIVSSKKSL